MITICKNRKNKRLLIANSESVAELQAVMTACHNVGGGGCFCEAVSRTGARNLGVVKSDARYVTFAAFALDDVKASLTARGVAVN